MLGSLATEIRRGDSRFSLGGGDVVPLVRDSLYSKLVDLLSLTLFVGEIDFVGNDRQRKLLWCSSNRSGSLVSSLLLKVEPRLVLLAGVVNACL